MPAVIRAASKAKPKRPAKKPAYAPAKLKGAGAVGLDPRGAAWAATGILCLVLIVAVAAGGRMSAPTLDFGGGIDGVFAGLGFRLKAVHVQGASAYSQPFIAKASGLYQDEPLLGLNLETVRERVEQVGWIKSVKVIRLLPDTLVIAVKERPRLAVWQHDGQTHVVDQDGQIIPEADPAQFVDLPLVVGDGAPEAAAAILPEIAARPKLPSKLAALVRVDARRWDLRLKDGGLIQLPAAGEDAAMMKFDELDKQNRLLDVGFDRVDLRVPAMIAVRPRQPAVAPTPAAAPLTVAAAAMTIPNTPAKTGL